MAQYLTFLLGKEFFALDIESVIEIVGIQKITRMPQQPNYVKGTINLRGKIIPTIDVRARFGKAEVPYNERTCIIVLDIQNTHAGFIVDSVDEVMTIEYDMISEPPTFKEDYKAKYVKGIAKRNDTVIMLIENNELLDTHELTEIVSIEL